MKIQTLSIVAGTSACDASCPYCISRMTPKQGVGLKEREFDWLKFEKACKLAQINNVSTVLITGKGEPLLYPEQLSKILEKMKRFEFPLIEIQTNGLALGREWEKYKPYLKKWRQLGLNTIALSIVHYKHERNKEIYSPDSTYPDLENLIKNLHELGYSIRLSCIMLKGYIDSIEEVKNLVEKAKEWDAEQLTIRSVKVPEKSQEQKVFNWTKQRVLSRGTLIDIADFFDKNATRLMTLDHGGVVYDFRNQNLCLTDCLTMKPNSEDLRQLIFFPDGHLRYDWRYKGAVLM